MDKVEIWVLIETSADRLDKPDEVSRADIERILDNPSNYDIVDETLSSNITVKVL